MASEKSDCGGYDNEFVDAVLPKYNCSICMKVLREAHLTVCCGQNYCETCLEKWLNSKAQAGKKTCPHCREEDFQSFPNKEKIREINGFKIRCTNGCDWVGELGSLRNHLESEKGCDHALVKCGNHAKRVDISNSTVKHYDDSVCGAPMKRLQLSHHQQNECLYRQYTCQHCGYVDTYDAIAGSGKITNNGLNQKCFLYEVTFTRNHYSQCDNYPLKCPNSCGASCQRKTLKIHRETCPLESIDCPFEYVGCSTGKVLRKGIDAHCRVNMQAHLMLVVQSNRELVLKVDELTKTVEAMKNKIYGVVQDEGKKEEGGGGVPDLNIQSDEIHALLKQKLKKGDTWYLIDVKWMRLWKNYVGCDQWCRASYEQKSRFPGPINTSNLFAECVESGVLREHLMEDYDYRLIPEPAWNKLVTWYGISDTSRPLPRTVVEYGKYMKYLKVEVYLLNFKLYLYSNLNEQVVKSFSRADTVGDLERELRNIFNIDQTVACRVWHRYMSNTYELLKDSTQTLQDADLYNMQTIVLQCRKEDGTWPYFTK